MKSAKGVPSFIVIVLIVIFLAIIVMQGNTTQEMTYSELMKAIDNEQVAEVTLSSDGGKAIVTMKSDDKKKVQNIVNIPSLTAFMTATEEDIRDGKIDVKEESRSAILTILEYITPMSFLLIFILFWVFMMQSMNCGKGTMSFTKNRARHSDPDGKDNSKTVKSSFYYC